MAIKSMTGFARSAGEAPPFHWIWEARAVNAKGLDLRLRLPSGFEALEPEVRARVAKALARGAIQLSLNLRRDSSGAEVRIDRKAIEAVAESLRALDLKGFGPLTLDGLLSIPGVVGLVEPEDGEEERRRAALLAGLDASLAALKAMREKEGAALSLVLSQRLDNLSRLIHAADAAPGRKPEAVRARLVELIEDLSGRSNMLDPIRLHQEAVLLAAKADVTEEIDRLRAHVAAAQGLLQSKEPIGRKLDFLSQELAREANTLCAKSNDGALTTIGIEMRVEIEQFREQVQNIE